MKATYLKVWGQGGKVWYNAKWSKLVRYEGPTIVPYKD